MSIGRHLFPRNNSIGGEGKSAYHSAVMQGFSGSEEAWLASLQGKSAYEIAVSLGFIGSIEVWNTSLKGKSAYALAVEEGFNGTITEWFTSLKGEPGFSAYEIAVALGFGGTIEEWILSLKGAGVPDGGTTGQLISKKSNNNQDTEWVDPPSSGGSGDPFDLESILY